MPAESTETTTGLATIVLDCSVAIPWLVKEQSNPAVDALFQDGYRDTVALVVPTLWFSECGNVLNELVKRKRLTLPEAQEGFAVLRYSRVSADLATTVEIQGAILAMAQGHKITFYDATYLELARRKRSMLATLDKQLRAAAQAAGVHCLDL